MALHPLPHRRRCLTWALAALLTCCICTPSWAASESRSTRKTRARHSAAQQASRVEESRSAPVRAARLYACHDSAGTSYSEFPCAGDGAGRARELRWHDARQISQVAHSSEMMQREQALLEAMARDRKRQLKLEEKARRGPTARTRQSTARKRSTKAEQREAQQADRLPRYRALPQLVEAEAPPGRLKP